MIMLPSSVRDFENPDLLRIIEKTQKSPVCSSEERVKFFKLAWDAVGSEFASRHNQYELFYAGASFVTKGHAYRTYDWQRASHLVDSMLGSYSLNQELSTPRASDASPCIRFIRYRHRRDRWPSTSFTTNSIRWTCSATGGCRKAMTPRPARRS